MNLKNKKAFTIIELMISVIIIGILTTIGFYSYSGHISGTRDVERKANMGEIKTALKLYKQNRGSYPLPGGYFNITNNGGVVAMQGELNKDVTLTTMDKLPIDSVTKKYYTYSVTTNKQQHQVAMTLENSKFPVAYLDGDYKTVSKNVLPNIILAISSTTDIEIHEGIGNGSENRKKFVFDMGDNLTYSLSDTYEPYYNNQSFVENLTDTKINFWQNSDFRSCYEIQQASKYIHTSGTEEYQILDDSGNLVNTTCSL